MTALTKRIMTAVSVIGVTLIVAGAACRMAGIRINTSKSIPLGLYRTIDVPIAKGTYVLVCPPQGELFSEARERGYIGAGFCPGDYGYLMKKVAAIEHDTVTVNDEGVRVNGSLLPLSAPRRSDKTRRPLPHYRINDYVLGPDEVLLMSDKSATSFDSRYFGPVPRSQLATAILALVTW